MSILTSSEQSSFCIIEPISGSTAAPFLDKVVQFTQNGVVRTILVPNKSAECNLSRTRPSVRRSTPRLTSKLRKEFAVVTSSQAVTSQSPAAMSAVMKRVSSYYKGTECSTEPVGSCKVRSVIPIMPKPVASSCVLPSSVQPPKSKTIGIVTTINEKLSVSVLAKRGRICARKKVSKCRVTGSACKDSAKAAKCEVLNVESSKNIAGEKCICDLPVSVCRLNSSKDQSLVVETSKTECLSRVGSCTNVGLSPLQNASPPYFKKVETTIRTIAHPKKDISAPSTQRAFLSKNKSSSAKKLRTLAAAGPVPVRPNISSFSITPAQKAAQVTQSKHNAVKPTFTQFDSCAGNNMASVVSPCSNPLLITRPSVTRPQNAGTAFTSVQNIGTSQQGVANICMQIQRQCYPMSGVRGVYTQPTYTPSPFQLANSSGPVFVGMSTDGILKNNVVSSNQPPTNLILIQNSNVFLCSQMQESSFTGSAINMPTVPATGVLPVQSSMSNVIMPGHGNLMVRRIDSPSFVQATGSSLQPFVHSTAISSNSSPLNAGVQNCILQQTALTYPNVMPTSLAISAKPFIACANLPSSSHAQPAALKVGQLAANPSATSRTPSRRKLLNEGLKTRKSRHRQPIVSRKKIVALSGETVENNEELTAKQPVRRRRNLWRVRMKEKAQSYQTLRPILPRPSSLESPIAKDTVGHTLTWVVFSRQKIAGATKSSLSMKSTGRIRSRKSTKSQRSRTKRPITKELASADERKLDMINVGNCGKCGRESLSIVDDTLTMSEICEACQSHNAVMRTSKDDVDLKSSIRESETADNVNYVNSPNLTLVKTEPESDRDSPISHHEQLPEFALGTKDSDCAVVNSRNRCSLINNFSMYTNNIDRMFSARVILERMKLVPNSLVCDAPSMVKTVILQQKEICHTSEIDRSTSDSSAQLPSGSVFSRIPCKRLNNQQSSRTKRFMLECDLLGQGGSDAGSVVGAVICKQEKTDVCNTSQTDCSVVSAGSVTCRRTVSSIMPRPSKRLNNQQSSRTKRLMLKRC